MAEGNPIIELEKRIVAAERPPPSRADIEKILAAFCDRHGLPEMRFDEDGILELSIGGEIAIAIVHIPGSVALVLCADMPEGCSEDRGILHRALKENRSILMNGGGTFGKVPGEDTLQFCKMVLLAGLDDRIFEQELMLFAEIAANWAARFDLALELAEDERLAGAQEAGVVPPSMVV